MELKGIFQRNGSAALSLAYVASGRYLGFFEAHLNAWDVMAGLGNQCQAGGWHTDFLADNGLVEGNPVIAGADGVREEMLSLLTLDDRRG